MCCTQLGKTYMNVKAPRMAQGIYPWGELMTGVSISQGVPTRTFTNEVSQFNLNGSIQTWK